MEPTNAGRVGPAAPIAAAGAAAASADHPARRAPDGEVFTTPGSSTPPRLRADAVAPTSGAARTLSTATQVLGSCPADRQAMPTHC